MGSIQSKIKAGYRLQIAPVLQQEVNKGHSPQNISNNSFLNHNQIFTSQLSDLSREHDCSFLKSSLTKKLQVKQYKILFNYHSFPYSAIGLIKGNTNSQEFNGTGAIIGTKHVLTCAHNVYSIKDNKAIDSLYFFPSYSSSKSGPCYRAKTIHFSSSFQTSLQDDSSIQNTIANDYAVIELDTDDNLQCAYGSLGIDFSEDLQPIEKEIVGYTKRQHQRHPHLHRYRGEGHLQYGLIKYDMPVNKEMGGSPIIEQRNGQYYIVGLHVYCLDVGNSKQRGGLKLGRRAFQDMQKWMLQEIEGIQIRQKSLEKEGLKFISKHCWKKLTNLTLVKCSLFSNCAKYLRKGSWPHLAHLDLGGNSLGKEGIYEFSKGDYPKLKNLSLWGNNICKGGAYYLTLANLNSLQNLNLYHNQLGSEGLQNLCKGKWVHLASLNIGNNSIGLESLTHNLSTCWVNLQSLSLWGNGLQGQEIIIKVQMKSFFKKMKFLTI